MNISFYTVSESEVADCYLKLLYRLSVLKTMTVLPMGNLFPSHLSLTLRRGYLFLFYSGNQNELRSFHRIPTRKIEGCYKKSMRRQDV